MLGLKGSQLCQDQEIALGRGTIKQKAIKLEQAGISHSPAKSRWYRGELERPNGTAESKGERDGGAGRAENPSPRLSRPAELG